MKPLVQTAFSILVLLSLAGCTNDDRDKQTSNDNATMAKLPDKAVFMRVNGQNFTKHDYLVAASLFDKMHRMRAGDPLTGPNEKAERAKEFRADYMVSEIKRRALMVQFARENKIKASEENIKKAESLFLNVVGRGKNKIEDVIAEYGDEDGALLREYLRGDAVDLTMREHFDTEKRLQISDADVMAVSNRIQHSVEASIASNKIEKTILNTAILAIKNGMPFVDAAKKYSLLPEEAVEWDEFEREDLADLGELGRWVKTAKVGDVSGVIELDDGFSVVKLLAHEVESDDDDDESSVLNVGDGKVMVEKDDDSTEETWTLVRICRKAWEPFEPMTRKEIVDELFRFRSLEVQKKIGDAIMAKAVIEWPHGTNLFNIVTAEKKPVAHK